MNVIQFDDTIFYVDSADGRILYKVLVMDNEKKTLYCTCPEFTKQIKTNPDFQCEHIGATLNGNNRNEISGYRKRPKLAEEFIKRIDGKDFVVYAGLLDLAHQRGLQRLEVDLVQFPSEENGRLAICKAVAVAKTGEVFVDFGDADTTNCNQKVAKHIIRMASTRAKARALRDFTNIGITCLEELGDLNEVIGEGYSAAKRKSYNLPKEEALFKSVPEKETKPSRAEAANSIPGMSDAQKRAILNLSKRKGIGDDQVNKMANENFGVPLDSLSIKDASALIRVLQTT